MTYIHAKTNETSEYPWRIHLYAQLQQTLYALRNSRHDITERPCSSLFSIQHNPSTTACGCQHLGGQLFRALIGRSTLHRLDVCGNSLGAREEVFVVYGLRATEWG